jgi:hypothetical protein
MHLQTTFKANFFVLMLLLFGCSTIERDHPYDQDGTNYIGWMYSSSSRSSQQGIILGDPVYYGGETYETVVIGNQTWLKRNLNVMHNNGNGNSACYNNQESNCGTYGRLYDWAAAMNLPSSCNSSSTIYSKQISNLDFGRNALRHLSL